jgi:hypothetical protein
MTLSEQKGPFERRPKSEARPSKPQDPKSEKITPGGTKSSARKAVPKKGLGRVTVSADAAQVGQASDLAPNAEAAMLVSGSKPAGRTKAAGRSQLTIPTEERQRMIAQAAYYRAERRGFRDGNPEQDWIEAEAEIDAWLMNRQGQK